MRFRDEVTITVESWAGWNGIATWRRENWVPFGWPSWWDGGNGWSVVIRSSKDENTLIAYKYKKNFKAKMWEAGKSRDQYGANAEDMILIVPVGTLVKDKESNKIIHIFSEDKEEIVLVKWWEWGMGNMHFKDSVHQFPDFALWGEPGQKKEIVLELQLLADVALIWTPSVWKSSLINAISHTKAQVAEYHFTTIVPNLGSVSWKNNTFNVIDIPGLIKWSADGKWLGNDFLRHVLKARVFCIMIDISRYDQWISDARDLLMEIVSYIRQKFDIPKNTKTNFVNIKNDDDYILLEVKKDDEIVLEKRILFVINKYDVVNDEEILTEYQTQFFLSILDYFKKNKFDKKIDKSVIKKNVVVISAVSRYWLDNFQDMLLRQFDGLKANEIYHMPESLVEGQSEISNKSNDLSDIESIIDITKQDKKFLEEWWYMDAYALKYAKIWYISDAELCKMVWMLPWWNDEAEQWFWRNLEKKWFLNILENLGVKKWDVLKIKSFYPGKEDRYILY